MVAGLGDRVRQQGIKTHRSFLPFLASHVLHHLGDKVNTVRKLCTWIKPGGSLVILLGYEHGAYTELGNISVSLKKPFAIKKYFSIIFQSQ